MTWTGFGPLEDIGDLLSKLRRDLARMKVAPDDIDPMFDFFVTALHMKDWPWPRSAPRQPTASDRAKAVASNPDLEIVEHLGNKAKHHRLDVKRHHAVDDLARSEQWASQGWIADHSIQNGSIDIVLVNGTTIDAIHLAEQVIDWWAAEIART